MKDLTKTSVESLCGREKAKNCSFVFAMHVRRLFLWAALALVSARCDRPQVTSPYPEPTFSPARDVGAHWRQQARIADEFVALPGIASL